SPRQSDVHRVERPDPLRDRARLLHLRRAGRLGARRPRAPQPAPVHRRDVGQLRRCAGRRARPEARPSESLALRPLHLPDDLARARQLLVELGVHGAGVGPLPRGRLLSRLRRVPQSAVARVSALNVDAAIRALERGEHSIASLAKICALPETDIVLEAANQYWLWGEPERAL